MKKERNFMDIGEVIKCSGLPASTLRYYEEIGLIKSIGRNGLRRVFHENVLETLALIALGRNVGFTLEEIGAMFSPSGPKIDRKQLLDKADQLDKSIKQFTAMRDGLRHAAVCRAPSHFECPKFKRIVEVSMKKQRKSRI